MKGLNDYKPVTVPQVFIKPFDGLVLTHLNHILDHLLDPLQFRSYAV